MDKNEAKAKANDQEVLLLEDLLEKQDELLQHYAECKFVLVGKKPCQMSHLEEMVKVAHKIRSLLNDAGAGPSSALK